MNTTQSSGAKFNGIIHLQFGLSWLVISVLCYSVKERNPYTLCDNKVWLLVGILPCRFSGLSVSFLTLQELEKRNGEIYWLLFYFHRFWRWDPPPPPRSSSPDHAVCSSYWWRTLYLHPELLPIEWRGKTYLEWGSYILPIVWRD